MPYDMPDDGPIEARFREQLRVLASLLDEWFNGRSRGYDRKFGFVLLVFPIGGAVRRCNYISNSANRREIITLLKEQIADLEAAGRA
ncbi:hypothetical protein [Bradyrhizobium sp. STM 3562]|uniref:hypothetical protein n=1 Tax=Bradyrhizobium sp. STM 3562 TaxID=578924 RepID=UPI00388ED09F